jgi:hypothetical protein
MRNGEKEMNGKIGIGIIQTLLVLGMSQIAPGNPPPGATMHGVVTDPTGAVIPNASVIIDGTNFKQVVHTDERGSYLVTGLPAGEYRVRVHSTGFSNYFKAGLVAATGYETEADAQLNIGQVKQEITVTE